MSLVVVHVPQTMQKYVRPLGDLELIHPTSRGNFAADVVAFAVFLFGSFRNTRKKIVPTNKRKRELCHGIR